MENRAHSRPGETLLGRGRSGVVFKRRDRVGRLLADKVFDSDGLTKLVQYVFLGAPNPYAWSEDAVRAAVLRRRILAVLVRTWFGDDLCVAQAYGHGWDVDARAWSLHTEFVDGAPPRLHRPTDLRGAAEVRHLVELHMRPLQERLAEAGFAGMLWQAGRGNPVALANFLRVRGEGAPRWAWIDLESGVPALFPAQPLELVRTYLPLCWRFRRPLFDDVDVPRLRGYLMGQRALLEGCVGEGGFQALLADTEALARRQEAWRALPRHRRAISARLAKGGLDEAEAAWFAARPVRWYTRELARAPRKALHLARRAAARAGALVERVPWRRLPRRAVRFCFSYAYRAQLARRFARRRLEAWERRGQLAPEELRRLRADSGGEASTVYLTDFGVHLAIKPFVKFLEWAVVPALAAAGVFGLGTASLLVLCGGSLARTLYTLGRVVQCSVAGRERPWVALGTGLVPVLGNLAFPLQIVYSSAVEDDALAQFLLYDGCTTIGRRIPIWGGRDTLTEHAFNHLPDLVGVGRRKAVQPTDTR